MQRCLGFSTVFATAAVLAVACGSSGDDGNGTGPGGNGNGNGDLDGAFVGNSDGGGSGDGSGNGGNCAAPVDMFIMFDRSGSMDRPQRDNQGDCNIGQNLNSKWCKSINALSGYFKSPGASGQAAAIQFFPIAGYDKDDSCNDGQGYHLASVPSTGYTPLPSPSFDAILNSETPGGSGGGTPTEPAIRGLTRFTAANRRPGRVTIGILITDGNPNGCNESLTALSGLLAAHYTATQIRTYVIGMEGASFDSLEKIAAGGNGPLHPDVVGAVKNACGGGVAPCRHWNVGDGDPAVFSAALAAIQESADGCKDGGGFVNPK